MGGRFQAGFGDVLMDPQIALFHENLVNGHRRRCKIVNVKPKVVYRMYLPDPMVKHVSFENCYADTTREARKQADMTNDSRNTAAMAMHEADKARRQRAHDAEKAAAARAIMSSGTGFPRHGGDWMIVGLCASVVLVLVLAAYA
jgi:hypothetical protein